MIPAFNDSGHLPVGGHRCTWEEFYERFRFNERRVFLCETLQGVLELARRCGFLRVIIGGSFPTATTAPGDIDLTWIAARDVTKDTVRPECVKLMDSMAAEREYQWSMNYLPLGDDRESIQRWASQLGFCSKTQKERGTLVIDL
jgi:hypothetical protein